MNWSYRFRIDTSVEAIYEYGFAPERWFSFYLGYRGIERVDGDWPAEDSRVILRYSLLGVWPIGVRQSVVEHELCQRIRLHEEALAGVWVDRPEFTFEGEQDTTVVTLTVNPTSRFLLLRPLVFVAALLFTRVTPRAMQRFKEQIEREAA